MSSDPGTPERVALTQELNEFLMEFSIALARRAMYPPGHPSLERAAAGVVHRLAALLYDRETLSIGVARRRLVIEGLATDERNPVLRSLAERLHDHHIGAVVFHRGVTSDELLGVVSVLGPERERGATPLGLDDPDRLKAWQGVRLYPLTYERLELLEDEGAERASSEPAAESSEAARETRGAQLWIGLARAALAGEGSDGAAAAAESLPAEPSAVARAINSHEAAQAYDQVIVGYLLQIAEETRAEGGGSAAVRRRMSRLMENLEPETLRRLVEMGGDLEQRRRFVLDATEGFAVDAVVEILRAAADSSEQTISDSMLRILRKLSVLAERGPADTRARADTAVREQVRELIRDWRLADPNPEAYTDVLEAMTRLPAPGEGTASARFEPEPARIVQTALEVGADGVPVRRAVGALLKEGRLSELVVLLEGAAPGSDLANEIWRGLGKADRLLALVGEGGQEGTVDRILERMGRYGLAQK